MTVVGWSFGLIATGVLIAHALTVEANTSAWLAVAWLPLAAKALWLVHGLWERTALTPNALGAIRGIQQEARDEAAVARARLRAEAATEETRLTAVTQAGARVARVQAKTAQTLSRAWSTLETAREGEDTGTGADQRDEPRHTRRHTPLGPPGLGAHGAGPRASDAAPALTDAALDALVDEIRHSETPALSYREMAARFRAAGHSASEVRLRAAWKRVA